MSDKKTTIEEIAKLANVSIATVSRVFNNKGNVSQPTKEKILSIAKELNFTPKTTNSISNPESRVILVCVPEFNNPFNSPVIDGIQKSARSHGYDVLFLQSRDYYSSASDYINVIKNYSPAGIIILAAVIHPEFLTKLAYKCPVVMCSEYAENYDIPYVSIDDVSAAKKATNYLISTGKKKIGMINSNSNFKYSRHREKGYVQALTEAGLEYNPNWVCHISTVNYKMALSNILYLLEQPNRPDALFTSSDVFAIAATNAAQQLKINVPNELSIIGFDDTYLAVMANPPLTTIRQPCFQLGYQPSELLVEKIFFPDAKNKQIILDTELIVRDSTSLPIT